MDRRTTSTLSRKGQLQTNLRASMGDGAAFGSMVGLGETYVGAFALAIGLGEVAAGLVASVPLVVGGLLQLVSLRAVGWVGGEKRWILLGSLTQALSFLPLVTAAVVGQLSLPVLLATLSIYWAGGLATGPAWNTWMETVIPARLRTSYFASRSRLAQATTLAGFLAGGGLLAWSEQSGRPLTAFAVMFGCACFFRIISVACLARHQPLLDERSSVETSSALSGWTQRSEVGSSMQETQPPDRPWAEDMPVVPAAVKKSSGFRLLAYLVLLQGAVQFSAPYFTPYMLQQQGFSYFSFVTLISVSFVSKIFSMSLWVRVTRRHSSERLLWIGGIGLVPLSGLWIVSQNFWYLVGVQWVTGIFWAAYELGFFLRFFEVLPKSQRTRLLTLYNFAHTSAICLGALLGGLLLQRLGTTVDAYHVLFGLSSLGRLLALLVLIGVRPVNIPIEQIRVRVLGLRVGGSVDVPVLTGMEPAGAELNGRG